MSIYDTDLDKCPANYQPLTPLSFLQRSAQVYPERIAIIHGRNRVTYAQFYARSRQLASALTKAGIAAASCRLAATHTAPDQPTCGA